jgi:serine/threonine protein kinase
MGCSSTTPVKQQEIKPHFHGVYLLGEKLGAGAFAQVRAAAKQNSLREHQHKLILHEYDISQLFAVKILDLRGKMQENDANGRLLKAAHNEVNLWRSVASHKHCARFFEVFYEDDICYMLVEMCSCDLRKHLEHLPELNERTFGCIFFQMLLGISHLHSLLILHRDIKPDNFLVGGDDGQTVKITDFGLSIALPKDGVLPGVFGTAPFMSPEMLLGQMYNTKVDVWAFAVVVYTFLFGNFPYVPKTQTSKGMKQAIVEGKQPKYKPSIRVAPKAGVEPENFIQMRSEKAMDFVKYLLNRSPAQRPSAKDALELPYMVAIKDKTHEIGEDLPSLRYVLLLAKKIGAFEIRDMTRESNLDVYLNKVYQEKYDRSLSALDNYSHELKKAARLETHAAKAPKVVDKDETPSETIATDTQERSFGSSTATKSFCWSDLTGSIPAQQVIDLNEGFESKLAS